ncbi:hypothetical protein EJ04DRAFT_529107 [Polyplosphaeria fusca]|uniref:Uncharacterized protein n=1 Tax=Polyplosphaeria fusca TaxID=682080 RepID=A0A9P4UV48_9PLEO|nr:hypothetical protein EJ04DRAFT_529107 [Polyplosphaeria fusca]
MRASQTLQTLLLGLLPLVHSAVLPVLDNRDEIHNDVIRYFQCDNLYNRSHLDEKSYPWQMGMAAFFPDKGAAGPPANLAVFEMYTSYEDFFYNSKGSVYGSDYEGGGGSIWADFDRPYNSPAPPAGLLVGHTKRTAGSQAWSYNCFTEPWTDSFSYDDAKYGNCRSIVACLQTDALVIYAKGTEGTVRGPLPKPVDIYSKFSERYDEATGICDETKVDLGVGEDCAVSFECRDNDNKGPMKMLIDQLQNFGASGIYTEEEVLVPVVCSGSVCPQPTSMTFRTMPTTTQLLAKGLVPPGSGGYNIEVATIKTTITCKESNSDKALCDALGTIFSLGAMIPDAGPAFEFAGIATEIGCGIAKVDDE